jgi:hypothetical protein
MEVISNFEIIKNPRKNKRPPKPRPIGLSYRAIKKIARENLPVITRFARHGWNVNGVFIEFCPVSKTVVLTIRTNEISAWTGGFTEKYITGWQPNECDLNAKDWYQL